MAQETLEAPAASTTDGATELALLRRNERLRLLARIVAASAGGVVVALAFPPVGWWPLAPLGVALITLALYRRRTRTGMLLGLLAGLGLFVSLLPWVRVFGIDAWIALSVIQALFIAALGGALALVTRLPGWPVWSAALWVGEEALRGRVPFGGFPWGRLAFSQPNSPFTPFAALGGAPLTTFVIALTAGILAWILLTGRHRWRSGAAGLITVVLVPVAGLAVPTPKDGGDRTVTAAAVQGNVPRTGLDAYTQPGVVVSNHVAQTHRLARLVEAGKRPRPDLVIWPESSSAIDPYRNPGVYAAISGAVRHIGVPVLVGTTVLLPDGEHLHNRGIVWDPQTGPGDYYAKRHLVPLGEYIPFRDLLLPYFSRLEQVGPDKAPGHRSGALRLGPAVVGDIICYEVAYDGLIRDVVRDGAQLLVVQTNNANFTNTVQPEQQLAISRLRAVEHGRALVVAATSGISAIIAPDGSVQQISQKHTPALLVGDVPLRNSRTLADILGVWPEMVLVLIGAGAVVVAAAHSRKQTTRRGGA